MKCQILAQIPWSVFSILLGFVQLSNILSYWGPLQKLKYAVKWYYEVKLVAILHLLLVLRSIL